MKSNEKKKLKNGGQSRRPHDHGHANFLCRVESEFEFWTVTSKGAVAVDDLIYGSGTQGSKKLATPYH